MSHKDGRCSMLINVAVLRCAAGASVRNPARRIARLPIPVVMNSTDVIRGAHRDVPQLMKAAYSTSSCQFVVAILGA